MSANFAARIQQQMHGSAFTHLNQELGIDLVSVIPTVDLSALAGRESEYPAPWTKPEALPADIVKSVLPSGRPLVAVRYVHLEDGKNRLILEIFFQRSNSQVSRKVGGYALTETSTGTSIALLERISTDSNWVVKNFHIDSIYNAKNPSATFQMIKALANGEPLEKTDGRYLPMYTDALRVQTAKL